MWCAHPSSSCGVPVSVSLARSAAPVVTSSRCVVLRHGGRVRSRAACSDRGGEGPRAAEGQRRDRHRGRRRGDARAQRGRRRSQVRECLYACVCVCVSCFCICLLRQMRCTHASPELLFLRSICFSYRIHMSALKTSVKPKDALFLKLEPLLSCAGRFKLTMYRCQEEPAWRRFGSELAP